MNTTTYDLVRKSRFFLSPLIFLGIMFCYYLGFEKSLLPFLFQDDPSGDTPIIVWMLMIMAVLAWPMLSSYIMASLRNRMSNAELRQLDSLNRKNRREY